MPSSIGPPVHLLPRCGHAFHVDFIDTWLKAHSSCPLCRAGIFPLPTTNHSDGTTCTVNVDPQSESDLESESETARENADVIEIRECRGVTGRSLSMGSSLRGRSDGTGPSRRSRALQSVQISTIQMKRSRSLTSTLPT